MTDTYLRAPDTDEDESLGAWRAVAENRRRRAEAEAEAARQSADAAYNPVAVLAEMQSGAGPYDDRTRRERASVAVEALLNMRRGTAAPEVEPEFRRRLAASTILRSNELSDFYADPLNARFASEDVEHLSFAQQIGDVFRFGGAAVNAAGSLIYHRGALREHAFQELRDTRLLRRQRRAIEMALHNMEARELAERDNPETALRDEDGAPLTRSIPNVFLRTSRIGREEAEGLTPEERAELDAYQHDQIMGLIATNRMSEDFGSWLIENIQPTAAGIGELLVGIPSSIQNSWQQAQRDWQRVGNETSPADVLARANMVGGWFTIAPDALRDAVLGPVAFTYQQEAGGAFLEIGSQIGPDGQLIDPRIAGAYARDVGTINASLELVNYASIGRAIGVSEVLKRINRRVMGAAFTRYSMQEAIRRAATGVAGSAASEGLTEGLQEASIVALSRLATLDASGELDAMTPFQVAGTVWNTLYENRERLAEAAFHGAVLGGFIGAAGTTLTVGTMVEQVRVAKEQSEILDSLANGAVSSALRKQNPQAYERIINRLTRGTPIEQVAINVEDFIGAFKQDQDRAAAAARELGVDAQFSEAATSGGEIQIPMGAVQRVLAGTAEYDALKTKMRLSPDTPTIEEATALLQTGIDVERAVDVATRAIQERDALTSSIAQVSEAFREKLAASQTFGSDTINIAISDLFATGYNVIARAAGMDISQMPAMPDVIGPFGHRLKDGETVEGEAYSGAEKGLITFRRGANGLITQATVHLTENANISTPIHELMGHYFLELLRFAAAQPTATQQIKDDLSALMEWFGTSESEWEAALQLSPRQAAERLAPFHEKFAVAMELYFITGRAPSARLRNVFRMAKVWMLQVYDKILGRNPNARERKDAFHLITRGEPLDPKVTEIFDRMFATREEIAEAAAEMGANELIMTREEFNPIKNKYADAAYDRYRNNIIASRREAEERLDAIAINAIVADNTRARRRAERVARETVEAEMAQDPSWVAFDVLTGSLQLQTLPGVRLNSALTFEAYPDLAARLPNGIFDTDTQGLVQLAGAARGVREPMRLATRVQQIGFEHTPELEAVLGGKKGLRAEGEGLSVDAGIELLWDEGYFGERNTSEIYWQGKKGLRTGAPVRYESWNPPEGVHLSARERETAEMAVNGASNAWIAEAMGTTTHVVGSQLSQIKARLGGIAPWESGHAASGRVATVSLDMLVRARRRMRGNIPSREIVARIAEQFGLKPGNVRLRLWQYDRRQSGEPQFSAGQSRGFFSVEDLQSFIASDLGLDWARASEALRLDIVPDAATLRQVMGEAGYNASQAPDGVQGVHLRGVGRTLLVADALNPEDVMPVLIHEIGYHHGMADMLGAKGMAELDRHLARLVREGHPLVMHAMKEAARASTIDNLAEEVGAYTVENAQRIMELAAQGRLSEAPPQLRAAALAKLIETSPDLPLVSRLLANLRQWLIRKFGTTFGMRLTVNDIRELAVASLNRAVERGVRESQDVRVLGLPNAHAAELASAREQGYEGSDTGEAVEWLRAKAKGLDMSTEARMARADREFPGRGYHGTVADITEPNGMMWISETPELANEYARMRANWYGFGTKNNPAPESAEREMWDEGGAPGNVIPVRFRIRSELDADAIPETTTIANFFDGVVKQARRSGQRFNDGKVKSAIKTLQGYAAREESGPHYSRHDFWNAPSEMFGRDGAALIWQTLADLGFDGIRMTEHGQATHGVMPRNIRSIHAAFDPDYSDSADLLGSVAVADESYAQGRTGAPYNQGGDYDGRRDGRRRYSSGGLAPLEGAPSIKGATGPDPAIVAVAEKYAERNGINLARPARYAEVDVERAQRIAQAYEDMEHAPNDPDVLAAYAELKRQTRAQYDALISDGYVFTFFDSATDPYGGNPWNAIRDLRENKRMAVYGTYDGYGTEGITGAAIEDNPMLEDTGLFWPDVSGVMRPVTANDLFRAVHDVFGHSLEGAGFRAQGEENAWQSHIRLYTGIAIHAATTETRGQNSWLNYGPHGESNRSATLGDTVFALQKTGLMPEWTWSEGVVEEESYAQGIWYSPLERALEQSTTRRASGAQWWATISRAPGVKKEELEWIGLEDWLTAQDATARRPTLTPAVRVDGVIYEGTTHLDALGRVPSEKMADAQLDGRNRGYVDDRGRFINNERATEYARNFGLIQPRFAEYASRGNEIPSEWIQVSYPRQQQRGISRDEVLAFVRANGVRVEETVLGEENPDNAEIQRQLLPLIEERDRLNDERSALRGQFRPASSIAEEMTGDIALTPEALAAFDAQPAIIRRAEIDARLRELRDEIDNLENSRTASATQTRWSQYTLPGGENYRELLLRLPTAQSQYDALLAEVAARHGRSDNPMGWASYATPEERAQLERLGERGIAEADDKTAYRSSHFDRLNILAHVRFNERVDVNGKRTLFIEEVQSDWHQAGRERGYKGSGDYRVAQADNGYWHVYDDARNGEVVRDYRDGGSFIGFADEESANRWLAEHRPNLGLGVPDAPFKNNAWAALALKRMIRWAADNGFDQIAWTPGQVQVERFNLGREMRGIYYNPETREFTALARTGGAHQEVNVTPERLAEFLGSEGAKQLLAAPKTDDGFHHLPAADLKIGGEGMRAFYDRILVNIANDLGKKFGARVGEAEIEVARGEPQATSSGRFVESPARTETVHSLPITDAMREAAMEGMPYYGEDFRTEQQRKLGESYRQTADEVTEDFNARMPDMAASLINQLSAVSDPKTAEAIYEGLLAEYELLARRAGYLSIGLGGLAPGQRETALEVANADAAAFLDIVVQARESLERLYGSDWVMARSIPNPQSYNPVAWISDFQLSREIARRQAMRASFAAKGESQAVLEIDGEIALIAAELQSRSGIASPVWENTGMGAINRATDDQIRAWALESGDVKVVRGPERVRYYFKTDPRLKGYNSYVTFEYSRASGAWEAVTQFGSSGRTDNYSQGKKKKSDLRHNQLSLKFFNRMALLTRLFIIENNPERIAFTGGSASHDKLYPTMLRSIDFKGYTGRSIRTITAYTPIGEGASPLTRSTGAVGRRPASSGEVGYVDTKTEFELTRPDVALHEPALAIPPTAVSDTGYVARWGSSSPAMLRRRGTLIWFSETTEDLRNARYTGDPIRDPARGRLYQSGQPGAVSFSPLDVEGSPLDPANVDNPRVIEAKRRAVRAFDEAEGIFYHTGEEKPTLEELIDAIRDDLSGASPRYRRSDLDASFDWIEAQKVRTFFASRGVDIGARDWREQIKLLASKVDDRGLTADEIASAVNDHLGREAFRSGEEMLEAVAALPSRREHIKQRVAEIVREKMGEIPPLAAPDAARSAMHNMREEERIILELQAIKNATGSGAARAINFSAKQSAQRRVQRMSVKEASNPDWALAGERRWARKAQELFKAGRFEEAEKAKFNQLVHFHLFREMRAAAREIERALSLFQKLQKVSARAAITPDYYEQIVGILDDYELRPISQREVRRRTALASWVAQMEADGFGAQISIDPDVIAEANKKPFHQLSYEQAMAVRDAVLNIEHLGRMKGRLLKNKKARDLQSLVSDLATQLASARLPKSETRLYNPEDTQGGRISAQMRRFHAALVRMEFLFRSIDGKFNGPMWQALFLPFAEAADKESALQHRAAAQLDEVWGRYSSGERHAIFSKRVVVPEFAISSDATGASDVFLKSQLIAIALNLGNSGNVAALVDGFSWFRDPAGNTDYDVAKAKIIAVLDRHLTRKDWEFVQRTLDIVGSFRDEAFDLHQRMTGLRPEAVEASPIVTRHGTFAGGYYPLKFDALRDARVERAEANENKAVNEWGQSSFAPMTRKGHLIERKGSGGRPVNLGLEVAEAHIRNVIHDIAYREALVDANKIISHRDFRDAFVRSQGIELYRQLHPWLHGIAVENRPDPAAWGPLLLKMRGNMQVAVMGLKVATATQQLVGVLQAVPFVGAHRLAASAARLVYTSPQMMFQKANWIMDKSEFMRSRVKTFNRDVREFLQRARAARGGSAGEGTHFIQSNSFFLVGLMDWVVSATVWTGAYEQARAGKAKGVPGGEEEAAIRYADSIVRQTQSAGLKQDLPAIMRNDELGKLITSFYSYFSVLYNWTTHDLVIGVRKKRVNPILALSQFFLIYICAPLITEWLAGRWDKEDEEPEEKAQRLMAAIIRGFFAPIPIVRDIANTTGTFFDYRLSTLEGGVQAGIDTLVSAYDTLTTGDEFTEAEQRKLALAAGFMFGLPLPQMYITGDYIRDYIEGEEEGIDLTEALLRDSR